MQPEPTALIEAWKQGDEQAVRTIFHHYYPLAVRIATLSGLAPEIAQDCAQEAFVRAFEHRNQLRNPKAFRIWFHRIITREIISTFRNKQYGKGSLSWGEFSLDHIGEIEEDWGRDQLPQPDEIAIAEEENAQLWSYVQSLPPLYRIPLALRFYGGFSFKEIAHLVDKREGTVRVLIHRALQQLHACILAHQKVERNVVSFSNRLTNPCRGERK